MGRLSGCNGSRDGKPCDVCAPIIQNWIEGNEHPLPPNCQISEGEFFRAEAAAWNAELWRQARENGVTGT